MAQQLVISDNLPNIKGSQSGCQGRAPLGALKVPQVVVGVLQRCDHQEASLEYAHLWVSASRCSPFVSLTGHAWTRPAHAILLHTGIAYIDTFESKLMAGGKVEQYVGERLYSVRTARQRGS